MSRLASASSTLRRVVTRCGTTTSSLSNPHAVSLSYLSAPAVAAVPSSASAFCRRFFRTPAPSSSSSASASAWRQYYKPLALQPVLPYVARTVPAHIERPPYAKPEQKDDPRRSQFELSGIEIKDAAGIAGMRHACAEASYIRAYAGSCVKVGRTTDEIDAMVHAEVCRLGIYPSPLGYAHFPKSICTSVNQVVVHGIPDARKLEEGDIINIDVSVYVKEGYHGDCSGMFVAGRADPLADQLIRTTRECLDGAIALCGPGVPFRAIGAFIQPLAESRGFSVVRSFCGHGIGAIFHMPPLVYHCTNESSDIMRPGMTFTIEPLLNEGTYEIMKLEDDWTFVTCDGSRSAQFEETILITETGHEILTKHTRPLTKPN